MSQAPLVQCARIPPARFGTAWWPTYPTDSCVPGWALILWSRFRTTSLYLEESKCMDSTDKLFICIHQRSSKRNQNTDAKVPHTSQVGRIPIIYKLDGPLIKRTHLSPSRTMILCPTTFHINQLVTGTVQTHGLYWQVMCTHPSTVDQALNTPHIDASIRIKKKKKTVPRISLVGQITLLSYPRCKPDKITAAKQLEK